MYISRFSIQNKTYTKLSCHKYLNKCLEQQIYPVYWIPLHKRYVTNIVNNYFVKKKTHVILL